MQLSQDLTKLAKAFRTFENKMEIYGSLKEASDIRLYIADDLAFFNHFNLIFHRDGSEVPTWTRDWKNSPITIDYRQVISHMRLASAQARDAVAKFIRENYKINEQ